MSIILGTCLCMYLVRRSMSDHDFKYGGILIFVYGSPIVIFIVYLLMNSLIALIK